MRMILIMIPFLLFACSNPKSSETKEDGQLLSAAIAEGDSISMVAQQTLSTQLKKALSEGGPLYAVEFCNTAAYSIMDSLQGAMHVSLKRASDRYRNPSDQPTEEESQMLSMFSEKLGVGEELKPVAEILSKDQILYARAIVLDNPVCLNCHGTVGTQIAPQTADLLQKLYPEDKAVNHQMGDLRGMWSIVFDRASLLDR